ncbi:MAG TPA: hypothetical protein DEA43_01885 [Candidatus Moranbacteria bacterium]|nr:hypothetical protein [Candidatus Moranbacteria bacterium]HBT45618.1 hypothetical protein [Candidatus Moranbacteria bacterium]
MSKYNVCLVPGTIQCVKNYKSYNGLDIWINDHNEIPINTKCFIGHSLGANHILNLNVGNDYKFIFINPLIKRRCFLLHFVNWIRFLIFEGFEIRKAAPVKYWLHTFKQILLLLEVDVLEQMKKIPKENIIIIRGKHDDYFCDKKNVEILKVNNFKIIEVEAGHDWNEHVARAVEEIIQN